MTRVTEYQPVLDVLAQHLGARLRAVVLFGSRARGTATPSSDHDLLVVADEWPASLLDRQRMIREWLAPVVLNAPGAIAFVAKTPREVSDNLSPLLIDVCADGLCLFGADYFEPLRARALAAVKQAGLERRTVGDTLMWVFPQPRLGDWTLDWDGFHDGV